MEKVYYKNEIRLGQALKLSGYAENGGLAKAMIQDGAVYLNGEVETRRGRMIAKKLVLSGFRNYDNHEIEFSGGVNVLYGNNAQ